MKPLVSILLTVYEVNPDFLKECLESILNQTYDNVEILVIDDCSPKTDYKFIKKISPKIKLIRNRTNLGMQASLNKLFKKVSGEYVLRLGADDLFDPTLIEKEVKLLEYNPAYGAICCMIKRFGRRENIIKRPEQWVLKDILNGDYQDCGYDGGLMFRANLLPYLEYDDSFKMASDFDIQLQILEHTNIISLHEILYFYRTHDNNLCKKITSKERHQIINRIIKKHKKGLK